LLSYGRWFSPDTPASSTTKTGPHDIAEIWLKVALKHQKSKSNQPNQWQKFENALIVWLYHNIFYNYLIT
jgi:hypothetical protein